MLSAENTDLLCRVGRGTPMGDMMRQYWLPVGYSWEYEAEGQPQRVRVLGEDLVVWRTLDGTPAFTQANCPHRGAGFFYGRTEEEGLRCAYHGWKFDPDGQCIDMPNEPAESVFKQKVKITAYKGADYGGVTWVYMGPNQDDPPGVPLFEWGQIPPENVSHAQKIVYECNWMQALEGELDSTHVYFLHRRLSIDDPPRFGLYHNDQRALFHISEKPYGFTYGAERHELDGNVYWRTTQFIFPIYGMFPAQDGVVPLSNLPAGGRLPHRAHGGVVEARRRDAGRRQAALGARGGAGRAGAGRRSDEVGAARTLLREVVAAGRAGQRLPDGPDGEAAQRDGHTHRPAAGLGGHPQAWARSWTGRASTWARRT